MNLLVLKSDKTIPISKSQQAFNRYIKKIENLQNSIREKERELELALQYYSSSVYGIEKKMIEKLLECIPVFYTYHKNPPPKLEKKERQTLKELIAALINRACMHITPNEISSELRSIIEDIKGIDFDKQLAEEFSLLKEVAIRLGKEEGLDIDLSEINANDSEEEAKIKFAKAFEEAIKNKAIFEESQKKKSSQNEKKRSKRQIEKEQKENELAEIQKKGLSSIYKQLAKVFHPDLEREPDIKKEKEALMKKLTTAYENQDLHTLLTLEIEWMHRSASDQEKNQQRAEEQLKVYNSILKEQVESLKKELQLVAIHPKYSNIRHIIEKHQDRSIRCALIAEELDLLADAKRYSEATKDLQQKNGIKKLKEILKEFSFSDEELFEQIIDSYFN